MRLTKRQLKRIIREEYSRLKRRGLIKESSMLERSGSYEDLLEFEDRLEMIEGFDYQRGELTDALENDMFEGDYPYSCEVAIDGCPDAQLCKEIMNFCKRMVGEGAAMYDNESDMY